LFVVAVVSIATATLAVTVVVTHRAADPTNERVARDRCESDVVKQLASPSTAKLSDIRTESAALDPDNQDLFSLRLNEHLREVDISRITVWEVTGVADAESEVGTTLHDPFTCRAYFVDDSLADTLVLFEHKH
jgi:hypothetical protein